jgi:hypothetical protein
MISASNDNKKKFHNNQYIISKFIRYISININPINEFKLNAKDI